MYSCLKGEKMMVKIIATNVEAGNSAAGVTLVIDPQTGKIYEYYCTLKADWCLS